MEHIVTQSEIKTAWDRLQAGDTNYLGHTYASRDFNIHSNRWRGSKVDSWTGCSGEQMQGWLAEGFYPPAGNVPNVKFSDAPVKKRRYVANDEAGELQVDAVLAGDDYIYREYTQRTMPRNINIEVDVTFSATTNQQIIAQYLEWVLQLVEALQQRGLSPGLSIFNECFAGVYRQYNGPMKIIIPLARAGEQIDAVAWRAFFSSGGYRMLVFMAKGVGGAKKGWSTTAGIGKPVQRTRFDMQFDKETATLKILSPSAPRAFDAASMNRLIESVGIL